MKKRRCKPLPRGTRLPKFNQLEMVTTFTYKPSLVKIDEHNFEFKKNVRTAANLYESLFPKGSCHACSTSNTTTFVCLYPYVSYLAFKAAFNLILITVLLFFPFSAVTLLVG